MMKLSLALGAALLFSTPAVSETILVHAGTLLAVPGSDPVTERKLVIRDGKIAEIRDGFVSLLPGEDVALIDLSDRFVMPGFIDLHVHLTGQSGDNSRAERITKSDAHASLRAAMYAKRTLMAGFTTVRNLGSRAEKPCSRFATPSPRATSRALRSSSPVIRLLQRMGMRTFTAIARKSARCSHHPVCVTAPMIAAARCGYK